MDPLYVPWVMMKHPAVPDESELFGNRYWPSCNESKMYISASSLPRPTPGARIAQATPLPTEKAAFSPGDF